MTKKHNPKLAPKAEPARRGILKKTQDYAWKHGWKWAVGLVVAGFLYEAGTWSAENSLDWCRHRHLLDDQQQADIVRWHWVVPRLEAQVSNLVNQAAVGKSHLTDTNLSEIVAK